VAASQCGAVQLPAASRARRSPAACKYEISRYADVQERMAVAAQRRHALQEYAARRRRQTLLCAVSLPTSRLAHSEFHL